MKKSIFLGIITGILLAGSIGASAMRHISLQDICTQKIQYIQHQRDMLKQ